jgi:hypothetical protein
MKKECDMAKRKSFDEIIELLKEDELEFIGFEDEYLNRNSKIITKCKKGHIVTRSIGSYLINRGCPECSIINISERFRGEGGSNWQGGKVELGYHIRKLLTQWKKDSMKLCDYECIITGQRFDDIHHLYGLNLIIQEALNELNLDIRPNVSDYSKEEMKLLEDKIIELHYKYPLGVCLCSEVHTLYHQLYGYGNNTPEQFYEFQDRVNFGEFNDILQIKNNIVNNELKECI